MSEALNSQSGFSSNAVVVMNVTKRDGRQVSFDERLITQAMEKAFCADLNLKAVTDLSPTQRLRPLTKNLPAETHRPKQDSRRETSSA